VIWRYALLFPDPEEDWAWAKETLVGLPFLVRVLLTLRRAGFEQVIFSPGPEKLRPWLEYWQKKKDLPQLFWWDQGGHPEVLSHSPTLGVRGGILFGSELLHQFQHSLQDSHTGKASMDASDALPVLISFSWEKAGIRRTQHIEFEDLSSRVKTPVFTISREILCQTVQELKKPGKDRNLLTLVGKPTDRWHVRWVRQWTFPALRWLARLGVLPNQISWAGFMMAVIACILIAQGSYWHGVLGALLLYASWVLDCVDGTLARLTFSESPFGERLDTALGHLTNLFIFSALIWAVYGRETLWKAGAFAFFILGGIIVAYRVSGVKIRRPTPDTGRRRYERLQGFLDKINHRDYAVWIFILALMGGFKVFLWCSVVGIQVYWMLYLWLILKQSRRSRNP
jgi:phosphatidylglycerophosphate synthase